MKTTEDTPVLSPTEMFTRDTSFERYKAYADIRYGSRASINSYMVESHQFSSPLVALCTEPLKIRPKLSQKLTTELFGMDSSLCP